MYKVANCKNQVFKKNMGTSRKLGLLLLSGFFGTIGLVAQQAQDGTPKKNDFDSSAFDKQSGTTLRWLGLSGFLINSRGTTIMLDPLLRDEPWPLLLDYPIHTYDIPRLDAVVITHDDNDHYSPATCRDLQKVTKTFHSTRYVDSVLKSEGLSSLGHKIGDSFSVGQVKVRLTTVDHLWQNAFPVAGQRHYSQQDACGFWFNTPDGTIWAPGDSRLLPEHLKMEKPDAILFDFSDNKWHFGLSGAVMLANNFPETPLLLHHWGSINLPDSSAFNGNPANLLKMIVNPERIFALAPGEPFQLKKLERGKMRLQTSME
jgi:L-ascorbate metabolism protein UlaG (beta-lactamase superfamily)